LEVSDQDWQNEIKCQDKGEGTPSADHSEFSDLRQESSRLNEGDSQ